MPGILWYFAIALFFLLVVILAVPSDGADLTAPGARPGPSLASGPAFVVSPGP